MSYLVLARKWRPQRFEDVVGQQHVTRTLANAIKQQRVAHSFLFTGSRGVGKTSTARILAKALNCQQGPSPEPCNVCENCIDITAGRSVDVIEIDGASNRGINEIREVRDAVRYAPSRCRYKVYIIDEVHMLTTEAFNALLKTLEEPPAHVVFIFATTEANKIPVTILSRCQRYDFKRVQVRDLIVLLEGIADAEKLSYDDGALSLIAHHARGGVRDALSAMDQVIAFADGRLSAEHSAEILGIASRDKLLELGRALLRRDVHRALALLDQVERNGQDLLQFAMALLQHLRDMTVVAAVKDARDVTDLSDRELQQLAEDVKGVPIDQLQRMFQLFAEAIDGIARSLFPKLMLEMTLIKLSAVEPLLPLLPLINRLEAFEKTLHAGQLGDDQTLQRYREKLAELHRESTPAPAASTPTPAASTPAASTPTPATSTPAASTPTPAASTPTPAASTPTPAASTPSHAASTPSHAASTPSHTASTPSTAASTPSTAASTPTTAASTPATAASTPTTAASTPTHAASTPSHAASTPSTAANTGGGNKPSAQSTRPLRGVEVGNWRALVESLPPQLGKLLEQAHCARLEQERIELVLSQQYLTLLLDGARRENLLRAIEQAWGWTPHLELSAAAADAALETVAERRRAERDEAEAALRRRLQENPLVQRVMDEFSVNPERIRIDPSVVDREDGA
ncbi:MAG: DNA polymerase III subunit gamma/tau [Myxococcota bacterium]|jgi:DNA polymerase-3 subunit gamma/tau|nr:DNA polymerase III subunit gamma/tau [Myxococcota bacterium]